MIFSQRESQKATTIIHTGTCALVKQVMLPINIHIIATTKNNNI